MKLQVFTLLLFISTISYCQEVNLIIDLAPGSESGIAEDATVLGTLKDAIIINNSTHILFSDGTALGTKIIYDLADSEIAPGSILFENDLYLNEYTSGDTSRIIKTSETGEVETALEVPGTIELYVSYKDKLYFSNRSNFKEFLFSFDPNTKEVEEIIELNWFRRDGFKEAIVFNELMYMIVWPEDMSGSYLATYDGNGNIEFLYNFFNSAVDQSSRSTINMTIAESNLFFWYGDGTNDGALYVTDGTKDSIQVLNTDFKRYTRTEEFRTIGSVGNKILFEGLDSNNDRHLWSSDGTIDGTFIIEQQTGIDITPRYFTEFQDKLAFCGYHGSQPFSAPSISTLQTDGSIEGTGNLLESSEIPNTPSKIGFWLTTHNDSLFMIGQKGFSSNSDLYKSDGTSEGTLKISTLGDQPGSDISHITSAGKNLFFFGTTDSIGTELFVYKLTIDEDEDGFSSDVDCDDNNPEVNPDQIEIPYNGIDDDCNLATFDDDLDQDGFLLDDDCNDENPNINPDSVEIPNNGIDEDCDGMDLISSIHQISNMTIKVYPNPVVEVLNIETSSSQLSGYSMSLYNTEGKLMRVKTNSPKTFEVNGIPNGIYILKIHSKEGTAFERLVISH